MALPAPVVLPALELHDDDLLVAAHAHDLAEHARAPEPGGIHDGVALRPEVRHLAELDRVALSGRKTLELTTSPSRTRYCLPPEMITASTGCLLGECGARGCRKADLTTPVGLVNVGPSRRGRPPADVDDGRAPSLPPRCAPRSAPARAARGDRPAPAWTARPVVACPGASPPPLPFLSSASSGSPSSAPGAPAGQGPRHGRLLTTADLAGVREHLRGYRPVGAGRRLRADPAPGGVRAAALVPGDLRERVPLRHALGRPSVVGQRARVGRALLRPGAPLGPPRSSSAGEPRRAPPRG